MNEWMKKAKEDLRAKVWKVYVTFHRVAKLAAFFKNI